MKKREILLMAAVVLAVAANTQAQDIVDAVTRGDLARVKELVEKNPELAKSRTPRSATLLHVAARLDNDAIAAYLIEKGADVNAVQDDSRTPLLEAGIKVTRVLVEHGADIEYTTPDGFSAVSLALHTGDEEVVDYLLDRKAKLALPPPGTYRRLVAVERAMRMANPRVFEIFCGQGLEKSFENAARMTLAHFAAERGSAELVQRLAAYGAPVDRADIFGWTPLHTAAYAGNQAAVEAFLGRGSKKNARTVDGKTPYVLAQEAKKTAVADYLSAQGADTSEPRPPALSGPYFGQKPPGTTPVPFVPGSRMEAGARDGSYLIFSRSHPVYTYQLFISFRRPGGTWNEAINLSEALNHPYSLNGRVTPDGKYLFFTGRNGVDYWVDASVIEALRPKVPRGGRP